jgi:Subtilase family
LLCFYTFLLTIGFLVAAATIWETEFEGLYGSPWLRVAIQGAYATGLLLPLGPLAVWWKGQPARRFFRLLCLSATYVLVLSFSRIGRVQDAQLAAALQIVLTLLFLSLLLVIARRRQVDLRAWLTPVSGLQWSVPLLITGVYSLAWLVVGSLGSWLDCLLNLVAGLVFGIAVSVLLRLGVFTGEALSSQSRSSTAWQGFTASLVLAVMLAGLAPNGLQYMLMVVIPPTGWLLPLLTTTGTAATGKRSGFPALLLVSLVTAIPFMLVDPDELAIVISLGKGELLYWVTLASLVSLVLIALINLVLRLWRNKIPHWSFSNTPVILCTLLLVGMIALVFLHAGPVFNGERLFVIFKDQVDVSRAEDIEDYDARRTYVYETLTNHALESQSDLRRALDEYHITYRPYYMVNALEVTGGPLIRLWLESRPEVDRVLDNPILRPLPKAVPEAHGGVSSPPDESDWNLTLIHAPEVWKEFDVTGVGIVIGQSDSGVDGSHPEFADRYRGFTEGDDYNWLDPWNGSRSPTDILGHGTHTLATALGSHVGVAPGAGWIGCVNLARNLGNPARYLDCMQFMLAPYPQDGDPFVDGKPTRSANVMTNSWGCPDVEGCDEGVFQPAFKALEYAGIFVVVGAGNNGYAGCGSITDPPAIYAENFTVGAVDNLSTLASFSGQGPVTFSGTAIIKPDIVAPGIRVFSAFPGGTYEYEDGTSMATPHVAGAVALLWSANPALIGNIKLTRQILDETASRSTSPQFDPCGAGSSRPNNTTGYGLLDVYAAVQEALNLR